MQMIRRRLGRPSLLHSIVETPDDILSRTCKLGKNRCCDNASGDDPRLLGREHIHWCSANFVSSSSCNYFNKILTDWAQRERRVDVVLRLLSVSRRMGVPWITESLQQPVRLHKSRSRYFPRWSSGFGKLFAFSLLVGCGPPFHVAGPRPGGGDALLCLTFFIFPFHFPFYFNSNLRSVISLFF